MKKSTLQYLANFVNEYINEELGGDEYAKQEILDARNELEAELSKGKAKADANRAVYAEIHDGVIQALKSATAPVTAQELETETGYAKGKITYGLRNYWADEVNVDTSGKVNVYSLKE